MESKITLTKHNTKEELYDLFVNGTPLPGIKLTYQESTEKKNITNFFIMFSLLTNT